MSPAPASTQRGGLRDGRPALSLTSITAAGKALVEAEGLESLSMRNVAAALDTAAASLYRHVPDRDALLIAILEDIAAGMPVDVPGRTPRARLLRRLTDAHDYLARHVWVVHILIRGEVVAANALPFSNACLQDFIDAGMSPRKAATAFRACWNLIIGELLIEHPMHRPTEPTQRSRVLAEFDAEALPALHAARRRTPPSGDDTHAVLGQVLDAFLPSPG